MRQVNKVVLLSLLSTLTLCCQTFGEISGVVRDTSGGVVASAKVTLTNVATNASRETLSNEAGNYVFPLLQPGVYNLKVEANGFDTAVENGVQVQVQQNVRSDFSMRVGRVNNVVEVMATAGLLDTENATVGTVIENKRIVDLPLNGRNFLQMVALAPNVSYGFANQNIAPGREGGQRSQLNISVSGQRQEFNRFTLDGIEDTDVNFDSYIFLPSIDALQEFKVQTGIYPAEFGREITQVNVSTKSGTNEYHGAAFEFLRNSALDANNVAFTTIVPPKQPHRLNRYGFAIGGPVLIPKLFNGRNRLFFMSNYEALRDRKQAQTIWSVPSAAMDTGNFSQGSGAIYDPTTRTGMPGAVTAQPFPGNLIPSNRLSPVSSKLLPYIPAPNVATSSLASNFQASLNNAVNRDQFTQRVDFVESSRSTWFGRYSWSDENEITPGPTQNGSAVLTHAKQVVLSNTRTFSPRLVNEFRFGYNSFFNNIGPELAYVTNVVDSLGVPGMTTPSPAAWGIPVLQFSGFSTFGSGTGGPYNDDNHRTQWIDNVSWIRGSHSFRFGVEVMDDHYNQFGNDFVRGAFAFDGSATQNPASRTGTGNPMADFLLGDLRNSQLALGLPSANFRAVDQFYYAQDTWKVTPHLTIDVGLRYENSPPYKDISGYTVNVQVPFIDRTSNVADQSHHPTLVRAGSGDFYQGTSIRFTNVQVARDGRLGAALIARDNTDFAPRLGIAWNPGKWTFRTGAGVFYVQDIGNAVFDMARNLAARGSFNANTDFPDLTWQRPGFPGGGSTVNFATPATFANNYARRTPYTIQYLFNIERQLSNSTVVEAGYIGSISRKLQELISLNTPPPSAVGSPQSRRPYTELSVLQQLQGTANANYNSLAVKLQRRFAKDLTYLVSYTWSKSMDYDSGPRPPANDVANPNNNYDLHAEYALSGFNTAHRFVTSLVYELPFARRNRFAGGWELCSILTLQSGFPISIRDGLDQTNTGNYSDRPNATGQATRLDNRTPSKWFNTGAYALEPFGTFGNAGRNTVIGPGIVGWDLSAQKNFRIVEKHSLQFRFEAFNLPNHPNWGDPGNLVTVNGFGTITSTRTDMRDLQLGLKYIF
jgi:hypothetical protein